MNNSESNQTSKVGDLSQSLDVANLKMEQLRQLFPEIFTEGKIDIKRLTATLGENVATGRENYELSWAGKADARAEIQKRTTATLRPDTANSVNWDATQNLYIEGENLEVLRTLQKAYFGKVKMIYIDPPYNTGNDSFVYPDDYTETLKEYQARTGHTDEAGFVNKQTLWKKNAKENGQFHSVWLSMMYPRLFLARNLLRDDGVIFVSIDDNEAADLKLLMDEIFGEENFIAQIIWQNSSRQSPQVAVEHEYLLVYVKTESALKKEWTRERDVASILINKIDLLRRQGKTQKQAESDLSSFIKEYLEEDEHKGTKEFSWLGNYQNIDEDWNIYYAVDLTGEGSGPPRIFNGKEIPAPEGRHWMGQDYIDELTFDKRIVWRSERAYRKLFINESRENLKSIIRMPTRNGSEFLKQLLGKDIFDKPKPHKFIQKLAYYITSGNDILLDFFSGSGTTAQAVLDLNEEDGGNRQFICVQMPEVLDESSEAYKVGYRTIADIGRARISKVIEKIESKRLEGSAQGVLTKDDMQKQALGFNAFKLAPSNFKEWRTDVDNEADLLAQLEYHVDSAKPDSEAGGMVYELLLKLALPITTPIESYKVGDAATAATVYMAKPGSGKNVAMFFEAPANHAGDVLTFILKAKPVKVLCLNKCFVDSQALTNFSLQLQDADIALEVL